MPDPVATETKPAAEAKPAAETKPAAEAKPETAKPEAKAYALKTPDKSPLDARAVEEIAAFSKARGLSVEQAQALLDRDHAATVAYADGLQKELADKRAGWLASSRTDKEVGGDKFVESAELAKRARDRFFGADVARMLDETGLGDHPEILRGFARIGKAIAEDRFVPAGAPARGGRPSTADVLFGATSAKAEKKE